MTPWSGIGSSRVASDLLFPAGGWVTRALVSTVVSSPTRSWKSHLAGLEPPRPDEPAIVQGSDRPHPAQVVAEVTIGLGGLR